jgi:hypothetical protein
VLRPSVRGGRTGGRYQYLTVVELLLPLALLRPVSAEDDIDFSVDVGECSASSPFLLLRLSRFSGSSSWWGRWKRLEGSTIPDGVLEVSAVSKGVAHVLVVWTLGIKDVVQCSFASMGCPSGTRDGWSGSVNLVVRPLLPTLVGLLVHVTSWCRWCRLCSSDEILSPFVDGDVEVCLLEQLLGGSRLLLKYGSDEGRVIGSLIEVLDHGCLRNLRDTISHGLKPFEVRPESFIPWLRRLVRERLEVSDEAPTEIAPVVDAVSGQVSQPLQCVLPEDNG